MHNEHVYLYYRWRRWIAEKEHQFLRQWLFDTWSAQEKKDQQKFITFS